ncbi:MAG: hypothetical protein LUD17_03825 [Bacteroidales bacterium]|nr:hypothetical protein [Bacteroidales bacterium]
MDESISKELILQMIKEYEANLISACDANSFAYTQACEKEIAREEGIAIGNQNAKNEIARNMNAMGLSASDIAKCTGLTEEEISSLGEA